MFAIMIFVILSLYVGKSQKLNIGVNISAGFTPDNAVETIWEKGFRGRGAAYHRDCLSRADPRAPQGDSAV